MLSCARGHLRSISHEFWPARCTDAWAYDHEILYGPGFGYATFWPGEESLHNEDGSVNMSAVEGAKGVLGLRPTGLKGDRGVVEPIVDLWLSKSSPSCAGLSYCDADGCPASWTEHSAPTVDAVLLYAHAMDALYRTAPLSMGDPDALYAAMLQLPVFEGVTGPVQLGDDGDQLARFTIVNLQTVTGGDFSCERRRRRASSISLLETRAAFVEVGEYDSLTGHLTVSLVHVHACSPFTHPALYLWQVSRDAIVFSQGTSVVPDTSICDGDVADPEYYTHVQTGCRGQVGPTLTFEWVKPPPDGSCMLPANVTVDHCSWSYPWSDPFVFSLFAVAPLPGLVVLLGIVAMACIDKSATSQRMARANGWLAHEHRRMGNVLAYLVVWLGIAAHTVCVPFLMADAESGEASENACVARWIIVVISSALVLFGITLRVGEEMAADQRENKREKRPRLRLAYAAAATLNFFAVIASSVAALTSTETNSPAAVNSSQMEVVLVGDTFRELELQVTRCRSTTELPSDTFWTVFVPWGLMHALALMVHCERIKRGLRVSRFPTLLTLLLHSIIAIVMIKESEPDAQTFFVRTPAGIVLGWATLITEVVWPTYQKYMRRLPKPDTLFVVERDGTGGEEVRFSGLLNDPEKAHHLFISYKWKTSYDKVLFRLNRTATFAFTLSPLTARCLPLGHNSGAHALREAEAHWWRGPGDMAGH